MLLPEWVQGEAHSKQARLCLEVRKGAAGGRHS